MFIFAFRLKYHYHTISIDPLVQSYELLEHTVAVVIR